MSIMSTGNTGEGGTCPTCGGPLYELGTLGSVTHYRCRNCGMDYSSKPKSEEEEVTCPICGGSGTSVEYGKTIPCKYCGGKKRVPPYGGKQEEDTKCPVCLGSGKVQMGDWSEPCQYCNGTGVKEGRVGYEEDDELKVLSEAEEVLTKLEDYLNNEPMTNMERHRGVEHAYYDKSEVKSFSPNELKQALDYATVESTNIAQGLKDIVAKGVENVDSSEIKALLDAVKELEFFVQTAQQAFDLSEGANKTEAGFDYEGECVGCGVFSKINSNNLCKSCAGYEKAKGEEDTCPKCGGHLIEPREGESGVITDKHCMDCGYDWEMKTGKGTYTEEKGEETIDYTNLQLLLERDRHGETTQEDKQKLVQIRRKIYGEEKVEQDDYCDVHQKDMGEHGESELVEDLDMIERMRSEQTPTDQQDVIPMTQKQFVPSTTVGVTQKGEDAHICPRCKRPFYTEDALDDHWLKIHVGE